MNVWWNLLLLDLAVIQTTLALSSSGLCVSPASGASAPREILWDRAPKSCRLSTMAARCFGLDLSWEVGIRQGKSVDVLLRVVPWAPYLYPAPLFTLHELPRLPAAAVLRSCACMHEVRSSSILSVAGPRRVRFTGSSETIGQLFARVSSYYQPRAGRGSSMRLSGPGKMAASMNFVRNFIGHKSPVSIRACVDHFFFFMKPFPQSTDESLNYRGSITAWVVFIPRIYTWLNIYQEIFKPYIRFLKIDEIPSGCTPFSIELCKFNNR